MNYLYEDQIRLLAAFEQAGLTLADDRDSLFFLKPDGSGPFECTYIAAGPNGTQIEYRVRPDYTIEKTERPTKLHGHKVDWVFVDECQDHHLPSARAVFNRMCFGE